MWSGETTNPHLLTHCAITGSLPLGRTRERRPSGCGPTHDTDSSHAAAAWPTLYCHTLPATLQDPRAAAIWLPPDTRRRQQSHRGSLAHTVPSLAPCHSAVAGSLVHVVWSGETTRAHLSSHTVPSLAPCLSARPESGGRPTTARHMAPTAVMPLLSGTHCAITGSLPVGRTRVRRPSSCRPTHGTDSSHAAAV